MNGEVNDNDYIGGGTPVNNIINQGGQQQPQAPVHNQQGGYHHQGQEYPQYVQHQQQEYPQYVQHQQQYYPQYTQQQHVHSNTNDVVYEYTNCKLMEIVLVFILFICLTNCIIYNLQKQFLPTNLYSRFNHPPWILVFINAIIFIIIYILLQKYAFN